MAKRLTMVNGDARDADRACEACETAVLPPAYEYCPYCGADL